MGAAAIPIITAIASFGVQQANQAKTSRKRDSIAAEGIRRQGELPNRLRVARLNTSASAAPAIRCAAYPPADSADGWGGLSRLLDAGGAFFCQPARSTAARNKKA